MIERSFFVREVVEWAQSLPGITTLLLDNSPVLLLGRNSQESDLLVTLSLRSVATQEYFTKSPVDLPDSGHRITLWEDVWQSRRAVVQSRIAALLGSSERIPARLTRVRRIDRPTAMHFLERNHVQVALVSKYNYGLFLPKKQYRVLHHPPTEDELLVAVATFAHPRRFIREGTTHRSFEMVRFANLLHTTVVGGLDKLLTHFVREQSPDDIMTYADLEWSVGRSYYKLGFEAIQDTPPQEFWLNPATMERYYASQLDEVTAVAKGYRKIQNAGSRKFVKQYSPNSSIP